MAIDYAALKADILANADPIIVQALVDGALGTIAAWYNMDAVPGYWIYKDFVASDDVRDVINAKNIADITSADRERCVSLLAIRADRGFSGANADDRDAWNDIFSAAAGDESQQAILALWSRLATYAEAVHALSTGTGADAANADTTSWQGQLTFQDVLIALNS